MQLTRPVCAMRQGQGGAAPVAAAVGAQPSADGVDTGAMHARDRIDAFFRDYARGVARWAARLGGPSAEVEDITQEVFIIAQTRLHTFNDASTPRTWLFGITENVVRRRRRRERVRQLFAKLAGQQRRGALLDAGAMGPVQQLERRDATRCLYTLIDQLGDKYRNLFILFELEGMSGDEITALTGLHASTVRVRLHRARGRFMELFKAAGPELRAALQGLLPSADAQGSPMAAVLAAIPRTGPRAEGKG